jgi:hypothetical protein
MRIIIESMNTIEKRISVSVFRLCVNFKIVAIIEIASHTNTIYIDLIFFIV